MLAVPPAVRVFLVDDHEVVRRGVAEVLEDDPGIVVVGEAGSAGEALARVPEVLSRHVGGVVDELLTGAGLRVDEVAGWAVHPGGPRILDVVRDELGLTEPQMAASRRVLAEHGNCSSATVLLVLEELADVDGPVVAMAFGPGLTLYAALLLPAC